MSTKKLDQLLEQVRGLPEARRQAAIAALEELVFEPYELSDAEMGALMPAITDAQLGAHLTDAGSAEILNKPWK